MRGLAPQGRNRSGLGVKQLIKEIVGFTIGINRPRLGCYPADILEGWIHKEGLG
jgi:hypothetical protein